MAGKFYVAREVANDHRTHIGYAVYSQSTFGGDRKHFSRMGQHESSLARAKAECEAEADRLQAEADANRARFTA